MAQNNMVFENMTKLATEGKLKYAIEFSEKNKSLEELLLYLWNNDINTIACCAGHDKENFPYIYIVVDNLESSTLKELLVNLFVTYDDNINLFIRIKK